MTPTQKRAFGALISVFFFWGFVAASNDILIPVFKKELNLTQFQSQLVSFAFYIAYSVGSLAYIFISKKMGQDILHRIGYRKGLALGLVISAVGAASFFPSASYLSHIKQEYAAELTGYYDRMAMISTGQLSLDYWDANEVTKEKLQDEFAGQQKIAFTLFISGLFIVGVGFSLQQTVANPLAIALGSPESGNHRLSLGGGINNIGTTIGPLIVAFAIFGGVSSAQTEMDVNSVKIPYLVLAMAFLVAAWFFRYSSIPDHIESTDHNPSDEATHHGSVLKYPQLVLGMVAIFTYVGVEVATAGNLPEYLKQKLHIDVNHVAPFVSLYWASLMIGRWTTAGLVFAHTQTQRLLAGIVLPYAAFGIFLLVNAIAGHDLEVFYPYAGIILILIAADKLSGGHPIKQLLLYSVLGIAALIVGMTTEGLVSVYALVSVGLFCSTLWPCIFTIAIAGLGKKANEASGYLIMMIMGGGFISVLQGLVSESPIGIQGSFVVGIACFAYLAFYAWRVGTILQKRGINLDQNNAAQH